MANLPEDPNTFDAVIYQLETTDPVVGGVNGVSNTQAKALANRTAWLKQQTDALIADHLGAAEFASDLSPAGYQVLPSGLIVQWGIGFAAAQPALSTDTPIGGTNVLPIAFPNANLFSVAINSGWASSGAGANAAGGPLVMNIIESSTAPPTLTDITFVSAWSGTINIKYMVIGY